MSPNRPHSRDRSPGPARSVPRALPAEAESAGILRAEPVAGDRVLPAERVKTRLAGVDRKTAQVVEIRALMKKAARLTLDDPTRRGQTYFLPGEGDVIFTGDLHGHKDNLARIIEIAALHRYPERHIILHEATHNIQFGLIDRDISFRTIERCAEFKCEYPDRVHIVMGNHELSEYLGKKIVKDGHMLNQMFAEGLKSQYGESARDVKEAYNIFFKVQALAVRAPNGIFMSHSIPTGAALKDWDPSILAVEGPIVDAAPIPQIEKLVWGRDYSQETADKFAAIVGADLLLCGHEACKKGFKVPNNRQIILDSKDAEGVFLHIRLDRKYTLEELVRNIYRINE
ncbi:MAG: metallophosphoesterase [Planctomycetales bacterium]|nr:metallophosphoesterase [Planctomycetales bacterium]